MSHPIIDALAGPRSNHARAESQTRTKCECAPSGEGEQKANISLDNGITASYASFGFEKPTAQTPCRGLQKLTQRARMPETDMKLTLREVMWFRNGLVYGSGQVIEYKVEGMPLGEEAFIADFGSRYKDSWRTLRKKEEVPGEWTGDYATVDEALAVLQKELGG